MPRNGRRPQPSRPHLDAVARWAPWAATAIDGVTIVDGFWEPGVTVDDDGDTIRLYDEIGFWGCTASEFADALNQANDDVTLRINSPGGDVFDGLAIRNQIAAHRGTIAVVVDGLAASAASYIAVAGDTVTMMPGSQLMIHDALGLAVDNAAGMRKMADLLDLQSDNIAGLYTAKAGGDDAEWRTRMRDETWYLAAAAVDAGLADAVDGDAETDAAPVDTLRMAWTAWLASYAGRASDPAAPAEPSDPAPPPAATAAFPWNPQTVIDAVERRAEGR